MDLSTVDAASMPTARRTATRLLQFIRVLWDQVNRDKVAIRASGLAFSSLLATVPLVAVLFALFSAFGAFNELQQRVQELLFSQLIPARQDEIVGFIDQFIDNTQRLGFVGFVGLIVTAVLLLDNIESNFNDIWYVRRRRGIINKLTTYTSVLVFGTLLIGVSVSMSARIKTLLFTDRAIELPLLTQLGAWLFSPVASFLAFLLMFLIIPTTRVKLRSAALGALCTAIAWELGKNLFADSVGQSVRYSTVYGSLAVLPIFMIWTYVTWIIVLVGLEVVYTHQHFAALRRVGTSGRESHYRHRLTLAVKLYAIIAQRYDDGQPPPTCDELADRLVAPLPMVEEFVTVLTEADLVREVVATRSDSPAFVPATSLERVQFYDVMRAVIGHPAETSATDPPLDRAVDELISQFEASGLPAIDNLTVRDFLRGGLDPA